MKEMPVYGSEFNSRWCRRIVIGYEKVPEVVKYPENIEEYVAEPSFAQFLEEAKLKVREKYEKKKR